MLAVSKPWATHRVNILFVHNNFPGQLGFLAPALLARGDRCEAIGAANAKGVGGVGLTRWSATRGTTKGLFAPATRAEADIIRGYAAGDAAERLRRGGFAPDLIIGHPGWGETLFLHEVFPAARQIAYAEFFYRADGGDVGFDPEFESVTLHERFRLHAKSATLALAYAQADALVAPTAFQAGMLPASLQGRLRVIHEGVDTRTLGPRPEATFTLDDGRVLDRSRPVVTFVSRVLEPMRGLHIFLRALPEILRGAPDAEVLVVGADHRQGYGAPPPGTGTWKAHLLREVGARLDLGRVHFTGPVAYPRYLDALAVSAAHVYLTYPFTLSWSLVEAMAMGCLVIGSDTPPVRDAVTDGVDGVLVDFFDVQGLADAVVRACRTPQTFDALRAAARATAVRRFDREGASMPKWMEVLAEQATSRSTPGSAVKAG